MNSHIFSPSYVGELDPDKEREDKVLLLGHSHVDLAFMWTKDETIHLVLAGMVNYLLRLMDEFPSLTFAQSSAQVYSWLEKYYPDLFQKIKEKAKAGQWEIVGGSWSEFSANLIGEESMVRQFLYGKLYFKEKFGVDPKVAWLPDSFGFPWTMPQVLKKAGLNYFLTSKLDWEVSMMKKPVYFPHHVFRWASPDGSEVLSFLTIGDSYDIMRYDGPIRKNEMKEALAKLKREQGINLLLYLYGYGDHGGGVVKYMVTDALSLRGERDFPVVDFGTAHGFFSELESRASSVELPRVNDELYLKTHRGTFTTEARVKKALRKLESDLTNAEKLAVLAYLSSAYPYPRTELRQAWENFLFMTTHDIADGTSFKEVYDELFSEEYKWAESSAFEVQNRSLASMELAGTDRQSGSHLYVFNPLPWSFEATLEVDVEKAKLSDVGDRAQILRREDGGASALMQLELPPLALVDLKKVDGNRMASKQEGLPSSGDGVTIGHWYIENEFFRLEFDPATGLISSLIDKRSGRQFFDTSKRGGVLQLYEDIPPNAPFGEPAWNMYLEDMRELRDYKSIEVSSKGPIVGTITIKREWGKSRFVQEVSLIRGLPAIKFVLRAFWSEKYSTLKAAFPLSFVAAFATYGIQFGAIQRFRDDASSGEGQMEYPRRAWEEVDATKVEVPAHRWADVDEPGHRFGLSLISGYKFGYSYTGNELKITLLRGPRRRDPFEDRWTDQSEDPAVGEHVVTYWLYPHDGDWQTGEVPRMAYELTAEPPLFLRSGELKCEGISALKVEPKGIVLAALKLGEASDEIIARLYNPYGTARDVIVTFPSPVRSAREVDLLETGEYFESPLGFEGKTVRFGLSPFEMKTVAVKLKREAMPRLQR